MSVMSLNSGRQRASERMWCHVTNHS